MRWGTSAGAAVAAALTFALGCGSSTGPSDPSSALTLHPQWEWVAASTCCGANPSVKTPASEGYAFVLQFDEAGTARAIRNDTVLVETGYAVTVSGGDDTADQLISVSYDDPMPLGPGIASAASQMIISQPGGGLLLRNLAECANCYRDWEFVPSLSGTFNVTLRGTAFEQRVTASASILETGDTLTITSTLRNVGNRTVTLTHTICGLHIRTTMAWRDPFAHCLALAGPHALAPGATASDLVGLVIDSPPGTYEIAVGHVTDPEVWTPITITVQPR
ncbi:MAG TPA: hypothetical protein VGA37_05925 [Gemmatimonadales bacterium]